MTATAQLVRSNVAAKRSNDPVSAARAHLDARPGERVTLRELAKVAHMSPFHLQREFKRRYGVSPTEYLRARRGARFRTLLREEPTVSRATFAAGYGSSSRVYEGAGKELGMTPATYRQGGLGVTIRYTIVPSPFGQLLVAVTERGVCATKLGKNERALERALIDEFPRADIERVDDGDAWLEKLVAQTARYLPGGGASPNDGELPFDVVGTSFQWRVWRALQRIPVGETRSYSAIARAIGNPKAVRAVAQACAANRLGVVIPCHRVIRDDGTLGGYRWGLDVKSRLLDAEKRDSE